MVWACTELKESLLTDVDEWGVQGYNSDHIQRNAETLINDVHMLQISGSHEPKNFTSKYLKQWLYYHTVILTFEPLKMELRCLKWLLFLNGNINVNVN